MVIKVLGTALVLSVVANGFLSWQYTIKRDKLKITRQEIVKLESANSIYRNTLQAQQNEIEKHKAGVKDARDKYNKAKTSIAQMRKQADKRSKELVKQQSSGDMLGDCKLFEQNINDDLRGK